MVIVLMGPSGSGKTTIGQRLADALGWAFVEGDDLHPPANRLRLARGEPLTDADRAPWLDAVRAAIVSHLDDAAVVISSALKEAYRDQLRVDDRVKLVQLDVPPAILAGRVQHRAGHFVSPAILPDQLATLEPARNALVVDATRPPDEVVAQIRHTLGV